MQHKLVSVLQLQNAVKFAASVFNFYSQLTTGNSLTHVKATHLSLGGIRESPQ